MTNPERVRERREYAAYVRKRKLAGTPESEILPRKAWADAGKPRR